MMMDLGMKKSPLYAAGALRSLLGMSGSGSVVTVALALI